jgi:hypothetical protein
VYVEQITPADGKGTPTRLTRVVGEVVWSGERRTRFAPVAAYRVRLPDGSEVSLSTKDLCGRVTS